MLPEEYDETEEDYDEDEENDEDEEEDRPWEAFGISEADWTSVWKQAQHANIDTETVAEFFLACFSDRLAAARAYACFLVLSDEIDD